MDKDKKQYTAMLTLIGRTGSGMTLLNSLNTIEIASSDPRIKQAAQTFAGIIRAMPNLMHRPNLCLNVEAQREGGMTEQAYVLSEWVTETKKYCEQCIAAADPGWIIQARAAGWQPPAE